MNRQNFHWYFILCFILILAVVAFYVSCKSKSPTESTSALNGQVAGQNANSTTQTTTSSSTTTTVKPESSPTNTTTLITSRNLTTTSTSTSTTTSIPTTTTTTKRPTTTSIGNPLLKWCSVTINGIPRGEVYDIPPNSKKLTIGISIKNVGTAPAKKVAANLYIEDPSDNIFPVSDGYEYLGTIPADNKCYGSSSAFYMEVVGTPSDDWCWIHIVINVPGCKNCSIDYYIYIDVIY